jgi:hypothetical protein
MACRRKKVEELKEETDRDTEYAQASNTVNGVTDESNLIAEMAFSGNVNIRNNETNLLSQCATLNHDTANNLITIDFGSTNCLCNDGRYRRGIITVNYTGTYLTAGFQYTVAYQNFFRNDNKIEGTVTVTYNGTNLLGQPNWTINAQNKKITTPQGRRITWNSTRTRTMTTGFFTPTRLDDEFSIIGNINGVSWNNVSYTAITTIPVVVRENCAWPVSGSITLKPSNRAERVLDYGNGTCDSQATVTINGNIYTISF